MNALAPPEEVTYGTLYEAKKAIDGHALEQGYAVRVLRTRKVGNRKDGDVKGQDLECSQAGAAIRDDNRARMRVSTSRRVGCPFRVLISKIKSEQAQWKVTVICAHHNHEAFEHPSAHPKGREISPGDKAYVIALGQAGIQPRRILTAVRQHHTDLHATSQDIYNVRRSHRVEMLAGRSPLQALLDSLESTDMVYHIQQTPESLQLSHLFIVSPSAREICAKYSKGSVWLLDATYKTNRYGLPLLHVVGITSTNATFTLCYCFMRKETTADYCWAMDKLKELFYEWGITHQLTFVTDRELAIMASLSELFPTANALLCRWHISKNIFAKQRTAFQTQGEFDHFIQDWNVLVKSSTEPEFQARLDKMRRYLPVHTMYYLTSTWLKYKVLTCHMLCLI